MSDDAPKVFVAAYSGGSDRDLVVPLAALRQAERLLDMERQRRKEAAAEADERASKRGWRDRLRAIFGRR